MLQVVCKTEREAAFPLCAFGNYGFRNRSLPYLAGRFSLRRFQHVSLYCRTCPSGGIDRHRMPGVRPHIRPYWTPARAVSWDHLSFRRIHRSLRGIPASRSRLCVCPDSASRPYVPVLAKNPRGTFFTTAKENIHSRHRPEGPHSAALPCHIRHPRPRSRRYASPSLRRIIRRFFHRWILHCRNSSGHHGHCCHAGFQHAFLPRRLSHDGSWVLRSFKHARQPCNRLRNT